MRPVRALGLGRLWKPGRVSRVGRASGVSPAAAVMAAAVVGVLVCAAVTLGAYQIKGAYYSGSLIVKPHEVDAVTFHVSKDGKRVTELQLSDLPVYCAEEGPGVFLSFPDAKISARRAFRSTAKTTTGLAPAQMTITGRFLRDGSERGVVTTTYRGEPACSGRSSYVDKRGPGPYKGPLTYR